MKISFDLDEILASFQLGWIEYNNEKYKMHLKLEDFVQYDYSKVMNISKKEVFPRIFEFYETDIFKNLSPVSGAQEVVRQLSENNEIYVLTSRTSDIQDITRNWINKNFGNYIKEILFSNQITKTGYNEDITKGDICAQYGIDLHIEDAPVYVESIIESGKIDVVLVEKPWNRNYKVDNDYLHRLDDISQLIHLVDRLSEKR